MKKEQELFWKEIQKIQNYTVNVFLTKLSMYNNMEEFLNDVTYETIYGIMELLDGYKNNGLRGEIIDKSNGIIVNSNIDLHNYCEEYLNCSDI